MCTNSRRIFHFLERARPTDWANSQRIMPWSCVIKDREKNPFFLCVHLYDFTFYVNLECFIVAMVWTENNTSSIRWHTMLMSSFYVHISFLFRLAAMAAGQWLQSWGWFILSSCNARLDHQFAYFACIGLAGAARDINNKPHLNTNNRRGRGSFQWMRFSFFHFRFSFVWLQQRRRRWQRQGNKRENSKRASNANETLLCLQWNLRCCGHSIIHNRMQYVCVY